MEWFWGNLKTWTDGLYWPVCLFVKGTQKFTGGTIFYDHASGFIFFVSQVLLGVAETIHAKHAFEREAKHVVWMLNITKGFGIC
jgi:hypothetical protein